MQQRESTASRRTKRASSTQIFVIRESHLPGFPLLSLVLIASPISAASLFLIFSAIVPPSFFFLVFFPILGDVYTSRRRLCFGTVPNASLTPYIICQELDRSGLFLFRRRHHRHRCSEGSGPGLSQRDADSRHPPAERRIGSQSSDHNNSCGLECAKFTEVRV